MLRHGYDETRGTIIGGHCYMGRFHKYEDDGQQGPTFYCDTEEELHAEARAWFEANRYAGETDLYPKGLRLKIWS